MNIKEAKEEIVNTFQAYHRKDKDGKYIYPLTRQRPILLIGPPGIGKTAIIEQAAKECDTGLVAYTITHHTRQSAVGLPKIAERIYEGKEISVTEYTMSEIISSIYEYMEKSNKKEGILFLDEINCVSETLAPTMLQFLQNKMFGTHHIPKGWMIVAAGNPPEYNKSVREFDIVTLDRVRQIEIDIDSEVWLEYAWNQEIHGAILSYLRLKKENFYYIENSVDGKFFVTARGWEDLSELLKSYEILQIPISKNQIEQFLQKEEIAKDFTIYYQLYCQYQSDYGIEQLMAKECTISFENEKRLLLGNSGFEEKFIFVSHLLYYLDQNFRQYKNIQSILDELYKVLLILKKQIQKDDNISSIYEFIKKQKESFLIKRNMELLTQNEIRIQGMMLEELEGYSLFLKKNHIQNAESGFELIKNLFLQKKQEYDSIIEETGRVLNRSFKIIEEYFGNGQEMLLFMNSLSGNKRATEYIAANGCDPYFIYSSQLFCDQQEKLLRDECKKILES